MVCQMIEPKVSQDIPYCPLIQMNVHLFRCRRHWMSEGARRSPSPTVAQILKYIKFSCDSAFGFLKDMKFYWSSTVVYCALIGYAIPTLSFLATSVLHR